ncbi:hypothetical protein IQ270_27705 [Microcoleus sp. LEGE 07076]|uniref:hypothetical protein n=1 Tax=Microcoleus sp. LEGE 07076 TaxID=915322 RepID=UPI001880B5C7|nr:hypothetical protein [Microcoleus sp. LEGE 07076]MBE9188314.1 hypothetical protein [Microcoleus sp. LEGE 07076]
MARSRQYDFRLGMIDEYHGGALVASNAPAFVVQSRTTTKKCFLPTQDAPGDIPYSCILFATGVKMIKLGFYCDRKAGVVR